MNYETIRKKLAADLRAVQGIGKVLEAPPFATDWKQYLDRFTVASPHDPSKKVVSLTWITRRSALELDTNVGSRDESEVVTAVQRDESWRLTVVYGFSDDETWPSDFDFQPLLDRIQEKFRLMDRVGLPDTVEEAWPMQLDDAGMFTFGEVLVHKAELSIRIQQRINQ